MLVVVLYVGRLAEPASVGSKLKFVRTPFRIDWEKYRLLYKLFNKIAVKTGFGLTDVNCEGHGGYTWSGTRSWAPWHGLLIWMKQ
jgi:hypothetical protein